MQLARNNKTAKFNLLLTIAILLGSGNLIAQNSFSVEPYNNKTRDLATGSIHVFNFKITNHLNTPKKVTVSVKAGKNWQLMPAPKKLVLPANSDTIYTFNCFVSKNSRAGIDVIEVTLAPNDSSIANITAQEYIELKGFNKITASIFNSPGLLNFNETHKFELFVKNQGNKIDTFKIKNIKCLIEDNKDYILEPDEYLTIPVSVTNRVDCKAAYGCKDFYTINLLNNKDSLVVSITNLYDAVPSPQYEKEEKKVFPISVLNGTMLDNRTGQYTNGYFYNIHGEGAIDKNFNHRVGFGVKGPDRSALSVYGQREEIFFNYTGKNRYYFVGDKSYTTTTLTEFSRYARGFEIMEKHKFLTFGAIYMLPRFASDFKYQGAVYVSKNFFKESTELKLVGFRKEDNLLTSNVGSFNITTHLNEFNIFHFEYALSNNKLGNAQAAELNIRSRYKNLSVFSQSLYSDKNFPGIFRNTYFTNSFISYNINPGFTVSLNGFYNQVNLSADTFLGSKPLNRYINLNFNNNFLKRFSSTVSIETRGNEDLMPNKQYNYTDNLVRLRLSYRSLNVKTFVSNFTEAGQTRDFLFTPVVNKKGFLRTGLELTQMIYNGSVNSYINYQYSQLSSGVQFSHIYMGVGAGQNLRDKIRLNVQYNNAYRVEANNVDRAVISANLTYKPHKAHEFNFTGFKTLYYGEINTVQNTFMVSYRLNVGVPLSAGNKNHKITGVIIDSTKTKLGRIPIYLNGKSTLTDDKGRFSFNNLEVGSYYLSVDEKSMGFKKVASLNLPLQINITEKEKEKHIEITYLKSVTINVQVIYKDMQENIPGMLNDKEKPPSSFVVEVSQGETVVRKQCDVGDNLFSGLYPGKWNVKLYEGTLPKTVKLETKEILVVDSKPGDELIVNLNLIRKQRNIKFQNLNQTKPK